MWNLFIMKFREGQSNIGIFNSWLKRYFTYMNSRNIQSKLLLSI